MKRRLLVTLIFVLLSLTVSVRADIRFENAVGMSLDSTNITTDWLVTYAADTLTWYDPPPKKPKKPDTTREYLSHVDTVIVLHRIECDTTWSRGQVKNDTTFHYLDRIKCDTIFRVEYRDVWKPMLPLYLPPVQWRYLIDWLREKANADSTRLPTARIKDSVGTCRGEGLITDHE